MDTPLRTERLKRGDLSIAEVARQVGTERTNLSRIETNDHGPTIELARKLYTYYRGEVHAIDVFDPTFLDEVGLVERISPRRISLRTRAGLEVVSSVEDLRALLKKHGLSKVWDDFSL